MSLRPPDACHINISYEAFNALQVNIPFGLRGREGGAKGGKVKLTRN